METKRQHDFNSMPPQHDLEARVQRLETALAHHQRDYDALNDVVTKQASELDRLRATLRRMTERIEALQAAAETAPRTLEDDKPPHY